MLVFRFCLLAILILFSGTPTFSQQGSNEKFIEGVDYIRLPVPVSISKNSTEIQVIEFFWYGCPHCYALEPSLEHWSIPDGAVLLRVPASSNGLWKLHAQAYYTLDRLGKLEQLHHVLFDALNNDGRKLNTANQLADFFAGYGIPKERFLSVMQSFPVKAGVNKSDRLAKASRLLSVPLFNVNGKYTTSPKIARGIPRLFRVLDYLITKEAEEAQKDKTS